MKSQQTEEIMEKTKKFNKKKILSLIKAVFLIAVLYFIVVYFVKNIDEIKNQDLHINWLVFSISMLFYFIYKYTLASLWHYITKLNNASIPYDKAVTAYLYSILGKYIPGKVFMLAARLVYYKEEDAPLGKVTICFFFENICTLLGAAMLFIVSLFFFPNDVMKDYWYITVGLMVAFFICIHPKILNFFLGILEKIFKKSNLKVNMSYGQMIKIVLLFVGNWLIVGVGFYMLVYSIYPVPLSESLFVAGIFAISAIIGILAIFAPSGIGVREGIMIYCLNLILPPDKQVLSVVIAAISRLWVTIPELVLILGAFVYSKIKKYSRIKVEKNAPPVE